MNVTKAWTAKLDDYVIALAWSPEGQTLAAASTAGPVTLFGPQGNVLHRLAGHADGTNAIAWAPAGAAMLASGGQDGCVRFWDPSGGSQSAEAALGPAWIEQLAWGPGPVPTAPGASPPLAVAAGRQLVLLARGGEVVHRFPDRAKTLSALACHPGGVAIAAAWFGGACVWDAEDFHVRREYAYGGGIQALVWSPDGRWLVAGAQDNAVHLWIPEDDQEFHMSGYETKVRELSFSADSRWLATGGARDACVWDCSGAGPEGREPLALPHSERVTAVAFQHRGPLLATAAGSGEACLWDPTRSEPLVATLKLTAPVSALAWSADDARLGLGSSQGGVLVLGVSP